MKKLFNILKLSLGENLQRKNFHNFLPLRAIRYQETLKWVIPDKIPVYNPKRSGDSVSMPSLNPDSILLPFINSKELQTANEKVKKVFSLRYENSKSALNLYTNELIERVKSHPYETKSLEIYIATLTARIRFYQELLKNKPSKQGSKIFRLKLLIEKRCKLIKILRQYDYKKFEWLLETLELEYKPPPNPSVRPTKKHSVMMLAKLKVEQAKEEKLANFKKSLDEQKIPFLEHKIIKLKEIKEKEEKYNLQVTVTDADIEECIQKLEEVKVAIAEKERRGYKRKIHPYFLEPYYEDFLVENEKAGEKFRESLAHGRQIDKPETNFVEK